MSGEFGNDSELPLIPDKSKMLIVDMAGVLYLNSYGLSNWIKWALENKDIKNILLENVPEAFMRQLSNLFSKLPANMKMKSFFVPYFCESSEESTRILLCEGIDFETGKFVKLPKIKDSHGNLMLPDINELRYFTVVDVQKSQIS